MTKPAEEILLEEIKPADTQSIAHHMREIVKLIGEDPNREGLRKTPERFEKALKFLTGGYHQNVDHVLNGATSAHRGSFCVPLRSSRRFGDGGSSFPEGSFRCLRLEGPLTGPGSGPFSRKRGRPLFEARPHIPAHWSVLRLTWRVRAVPPASADPL